LPSSRSSILPNAGVSPSNGGDNPEETGGDENEQNEVARSDTAAGAAVLGTEGDDIIDSGAGGDTRNGDGDDCSSLRRR
jgi:hypothetical protein